MLKRNPGLPGGFRTQGEIMSTTYYVKRIIVGSLLSGSVALAGLGLSMGTAQAFNPQPDPPSKVASMHPVNPGEIRGFDPQPDPPALNPGVIRGFNPQPEPPVVPAVR
jgi:hypothetical protein